MRRWIGAVVLTCLFFSPLYAQRGSSSSSSSGSSRGSSGSSWSGGSSSKPSGGSSSGWSGGSSSKPNTPAPAPAKPSTPAPGSKSGWSGGSAPKNSSGWSGGSSSAAKPSTPTKPLPPSFDKLALADAKKAESRANYKASQQPKESYKTPAGKELKLDPKDKELASLRRELDQEKWVNRSRRQEVVYTRYASRPNYTVVYNDPYHPAFNYWLLDQTVDTMALWCYHHQRSMDQARLNALYSQNAGLQARVQQFELQKLQRDPGYVPPGIERDLVYDDAYLDAVYNPEPQPAPAAAPVNWHRFWHGVWVLLKWTFYLAVAAGLVYLFFFYRPRA